METENFTSSQMALVTIDSLLVALPQNQVITLEPVEDIDRDRAEGLSLGIVSNDGGDYPVYNLNENFHITDESVDRRIVVVLSNDGKDFAIMANELSIISGRSLVWDELPKAIRTNETPVVQIAIRDGDLICATRPQDIFEKLINPQDDSKAA